MSNFEHLIREDSTEFEKAFLKIYDGSLWTALDKMKDWQPPKPQQALPVVPEDVDKAIKYLINNVNSTFSDLCDILTNKGLNWLNDFQFKDRRFGFGGLNNKLFILSHLAITGYTVEKPKEKLYFVKLPGITSLDAHLCKSCSPGEIGYHEVYSSKEPNKISFSSRYDKKYSGGWQRQFTESEIKAIDERYWTFAVPVEEVEP